MGRSFAFLAVLVATALCVAGSAGAASLKRSTARSVTRNVVNRAADRLDTAQLDDVITVEVRTRKIGPCKRKGSRHVRCRIVMRGLIHDPDLGDLPFRCYAREEVRRARRSGRIRKHAKRQRCRGDLVDLRKDLTAQFKRSLR